MKRSAYCGTEPLARSNRSNRRRCGLAMRYLSADVCAYLGLNANSIRCRGTDAGGHWANHPRPHGEHIPTPQSAAAADPVREASLSPTASSNEGGGEVVLHIRPQHQS